MTVGLSATAVANGWLDTLGATAYTAPAGFYVKLHTADPGSAGTTAASAETDRKSVSWSSASAGSKSMSGTVSWTAWDAGSETISHVSFWSASSGGTFLGSAALTASKAVANGDTLTLSTLTIALTPIAA